MPDWKGSQRRHTLPTDWLVRRDRALERDHHRCQHVRQDTGRRCLARANEVDHIVRPADGGSDDLANLMSLCTWHHHRKSSSEGGVASSKARAQRRAVEPKPMHPGLMSQPPTPARSNTPDVPPPF